ncbi:MAG: hypothetical protein QNL62_02570 [Gammaproteobacteria bacterium]|nr:hypothetical protein [Gammaproteobacteria bacterium]
MSFFSKTKIVGKVLSRMGAILLFVIVSLIVFGSFREFSAKSNAREFCEATSIGDNAEGILEQSITKGANKMHTHRWHQEGKMNSLAVTFIGMPPFSRYYCLIKAENGIVVEKSIRHLD